MNRDIQLIVVHCSATNPHMDIGANEIHDWHTKPKSKGGRGWSDIGYHNIIRRNGVLEHGRGLARAGAHAKGHNYNSIGICMVGGVDINGNAVNNFTDEQFKTLRGYLDTMLEVFPGSELVGHRDLSVDLDGDGVVEPSEWMKECPSFDVREWYYRG